MTKCVCMCICLCINVSISLLFGQSVVQSSNIVGQPVSFPIRWSVCRPPYVPVCLPSTRFGGNPVFGVRLFIATLMATLLHFRPLRVDRLVCICRRSTVDHQLTALFLAARSYACFCYQSRWNGLLWQPFKCCI